MADRVCKGTGRPADRTTKAAEIGAGEIISYPRGICPECGAEVSTSMDSFIRRHAPRDADG
jgi:hypothetical protein